MSFQAICWAFNQKLERSSAKFVLVCLANYANESFEAYPSTETLSELTAMDRKTVIDRLDDLCITGLIRDTGRRVGLTKQVKVYQLNYQERLPKTEPSQKRNCSVFPSEGSQKRDTKGSQKRYTEPVREPVREPGEGKPTPSKFPLPKKMTIPGGGIYQRKAVALVDLARKQQDLIWSMCKREKLLVPGEVGKGWQLPPEAQDAVEQWRKRIDQINEATIP